MAIDDFDFILISFSSFSDHSNFTNASIWALCGKRDNGDTIFNKLQLVSGKEVYIKSVNLQYNTLGRLDNGTNKSSTKRLMFQVFFFHDFLQNSLQKSFQFISLFF